MSRPASPRRRLGALLAAAAFGLLPACPASPADWSPELKAFARDDAAHPSPPNVVLFIGSSSIQLWDTMAADFPDVRVRNRGLGGAQISDLLVHFDRLVLPHQARLIVFYAGTNDLAAGKSPEQVAADFREFCARVHAALPAARVLCLSAQLNPARWALRDKFTLLNLYFAAYCTADPRRLYVETNVPMLTPEGNARSGFFREDQLHLSPAGYAVWRRLLTPLLTPGPAVPRPPQA